MFLRIWRAHWVSSRQQAARVPFAIAHWHAALVLACASTVMCVQVLPRLLLRTAPAGVACARACTLSHAS